MKAVHSWLAELTQIPDDPQDVAHLLSDLGLAVDSVDVVGGSVPGVVTARVLRTERHPDAAKVHRVFVDTGDGIERHVWCGAFNMSAGDIVPLATPGTRMPDGRLIEPKPILGIQSDGMLCSARELGLGQDHSGILLMDPSSALGIPYGDIMGLRQEIVYDLDVLRNRPEAFGHVGVARDVAARLQIPFVREAIDVEAGGAEVIASVDVHDVRGCARFNSIVLSGIVVTESPDWMSSRLAAAGMRPINNVVDVSNYVMLELNQPNHAYDYDTLGGGGFIVRRARDGEVLVTLDDVERSLDADDLLICDADDRPIGLAGIMGGQNTEISATTTRIALEVAYFDAPGILRTVQKYSVRTEASARFERGVDPFGIDGAIGRFIELLQLTCPDLVVHRGAQDVRSEFLPTPQVVNVRSERVSSLLGRTFAEQEITDLITPIGFVVDASTTEGSMLVTVPTWRPDCSLEIDIVEEVARQFGYDNLGKSIPKSSLPGGLSRAQQRRRTVRDVLLGLGIHEAMPHPFLAEGDLSDVGLEERAVRIVNPLAVGDDVLRTSLRPGLLKAITFNESHRRSGVGFFEIGHVYPPSDDVLPAEYEALGVIVGGTDAGHMVHMWRELSSAMGWGARLDQSRVPSGLHPTRSATLSIGKDVVGAVGEIDPAVLERLGVGQRCGVLELNLSVMLGLEPKIPQWKPTSRYPSSDFDVAVVVPDTVTADKVDKALRQAAGALLVDLVLFDVYRMNDVVGARSLAYRLRLQALDRTLTDEETAQVRTRCIAAVTKLGASLRE